MAADNPRCFAWCVSFKHACSDRWARFRNRFRRRFYATRGHSIDQLTILNETGTPDMNISKVSYRANKVVPKSPVLNSVSSTDTEKYFERLEMADNAVTESLTNIVLVGDTNQSAANGTKPRCIKEFMDMFGVASGETAEDGLPPVSC